MPSDDDTLHIKRNRQVSLFAADRRVLGVGLGGNLDATGHPTGELAIWVVTYANPAPGLPPIRDVVPPVLDGVRTHLIEVTKDAPEFQGKRAAGGSWVRGYASAPGHPDTVVGTGTLGIAARTEGTPDDKRPDVLLSCRHVLGAQPGGRVVEFSCSQCCEPAVGRVVLDDQAADAAIASINGDWEVEEGRIDGVKLAGLASVTPLGSWSSLTPDVLPALRNFTYGVAKCGAETGWTKGLVGCVDFALFPENNQVQVPSILISSTGKDATAFSQHGDSGSVVIDGRQRVIGLLWGGSSTADGIGLTYAVPIQEVERRLKIRVAATSPAVWGAIVTPAPPGGPHHALAGTESGRAILDMYGRHEPEVRALLRDSRPFVVAWHRGRGPELVAALTALAERRTEALPAEIAGRSWADRVAELSGAVRGLGSPALVHDLDRVTPILAGLGGRGYEQALELVAGLEPDLEAAP
ncbi:hypothetical protein [Actinacidiphila acidipaludis]|uniref:Uncharacterized protein n=1 Tax=Actinacidiphila acidipaludis TaxID=2873382 RepID=A0ABS7Q2J4_9ACTN|nr:hypothetical protein [Streptomyces acidipaludis]MBY8877356.1 hypothetical protein [Streptomyces acidipaludis]